MIFLPRACLQMEHYYHDHHHPGHHRNTLPSVSAAASAAAAAATDPSLCYCRVHGTVAQQAADGSLYAASPAPQPQSSLEARKVAVLEAMVRQQEEQQRQQRQQQRLMQLQHQQERNLLQQQQHMQLQHYADGSYSGMQQQQQQQQHRHHHQHRNHRQQSNHHQGRHGHHQHHHHHHHHGHHGRHKEESVRRPPAATAAQDSYIHCLQHPQFYYHQSAPSSPASAASSRYASNPSVLAAVAKPHNKGSRKSSAPPRQQQLCPEHGAVSAETASSATMPALSTSSVATESSERGVSCCGRAGEMSILRKRRGDPRLSASYSALDTVSLESSDTSATAATTASAASLFDRGSGGSSSAPNQKTVTEAVKNVAKWVSNVGDRVGRGTTALLDSLPSVGSISRDHDHHVVMNGLDAAGQTTVLYRLKFDQYVSTVPTIGFNCERVRGTAGASRGLTFQVWDVGGQEKIRPLWKPYTRATDGIIFVVDSTDPPERLDEARLELHAIMTRTADNARVPLLVVANKQDLPAARPVSELESLLGLGELKQMHHAEAVCAVTGEGLDVAIDKLHDMILRRRKMNKRERNKTR